MKRFLVLALLFTLRAEAQTHIVQVVTHTGDPYAKYVIPLAPTQPGDMLLLYGQLGNNKPAIQDTQQNIWLQANKDDIEVQYVGASKGGPESITFTYQSPDYLRIIIVEFAGSWVLSDVIPSRCLDPTCNPPYGGQSLTYNDNTSTPSSAPLTTTQPNELVVGYGDSDRAAPFYSITPEAGWTLAGFIPNRSLQYTMMPTPGVITSTFTEPFLPEGIYATEGIIAFKPVGAPPPPPHSISLTWAENNPPTGTSYNVYRGVGPQCTMVLLANVATTSYTDSTIVPGTGYCYRVRALLNGAESDGPFVCAALTVQ